MDQLFDYAYAIPYFRGKTLGILEPGPSCPKCQKALLAFKLTSHFNVGRLGSNEPNCPWKGKDYLEKAIFVYSMLAVCAELDLSADSILEYYQLDMPAKLLSGRKLSLPIMLDIRNHLTACVVAGEATFQPSVKMQAIIEKEMGPMLQLLQGTESSKKWWEFWK